MNGDTVTGQNITTGQRQLPKQSWDCANSQSTGDRLRSEHQTRIENLWERLSASTVPYRFPRWYALLLELRSFCHRIQLLRRRGRIAYLEMGPVWEASATGDLVPNKRGQARSQDMQEFLSSSPWLSPEDCHEYLIGWDAGEGYALGTRKSSNSVDAVPLPS